MVASDARGAARHDSGRHQRDPAQYHRRARPRPAHVLNWAGAHREQQAEALIAKMKAARGYMYPEWEFAARQDPEFVEAYNRLYELSLGEGQHVSAKVREFVAIALLCFRGGERAGLVAHMRRAIQFGATPAELFEVLEACVVPGGAPTFHRGLGALMEVVGPAPR